MPFDEGAAPVFEAKVLAGAYAPFFYFWRKGVMVMEFCPECGAQILHMEGCDLCACCGYSSCNCGICNGKEEADVQSEDRARPSEKIVSA